MVTFKPEKFDLDGQCLPSRVVKIFPCHWVPTPRVATSSPGQRVQSLQDLPVWAVTQTVTLDLQSLNPGAFASILTGMLTRVSVCLPLTSNSVREHVVLPHRAIVSTPVGHAFLHRSWDRGQGLLRLWGFYMPHFSAGCGRERSDIFSS